MVVVDEAVNLSFCSVSIAEAGFPWVWLIWTLKVFQASMCDASVKNFFAHFFSLSCAQPQLLNCAFVFCKVCTSFLQGYRGRGSNYYGYRNYNQGGYNNQRGGGWNNHRGGYHNRDGYTNGSGGGNPRFQRGRGRGGRGRGGWNQGVSNF